MPQTEYELALCRKIYQGDEQALAELIDAYRAPLTAFVGGILRDPEAAEEITIDVFVDLVNKKAAYRGRSGLKTFLFSVGRNKSLRYLRKKKQTPLTFLDDAAYVQSVSLSLEETVEQNEQRQAVCTALQRLRPAYREVLFLLYYENMTNQQAAVVLHKSAKQVANLAYRAKSALRSILEQEGGIRRDE